MGGNHDHHQKHTKHMKRSTQRGSTSTRSSSVSPRTTPDQHHTSESNYDTDSLNEPYETYVPYINEPDETNLSFIQRDVEPQEYTADRYQEDTPGRSQTSAGRIPPDVIHHSAYQQHYSPSDTDHYPSWTTTNNNQVATSFGMTALYKWQQDYAYTEDIYQGEASASNTSSRGIAPDATHRSAHQQYYSESDADDYPSSTTSNNIQVATSYRVTALNKGKEDVSLTRVNYDNAAILYCQQERPQLRRWTNETNNSNLHTGEVLERRCNWEHERLERL